MTFIWMSKDFSPCGLTMRCSERFRAVTAPAFLRLTFCGFFMLSFRSARLGYLGEAGAAPALHRR